ncbi:efflux RND transporter periplasmic adaptor subunit [Amphritea sp. HPY]|uniref:efflux RND transporter periplasmic adaptor subunit n=1 Tax=Amphritea sp. HPY TaxID=3421652 RepID=UPI003D7EF25F
MTRTLAGLLLLLWLPASYGAERVVRVAPLQQLQVRIEQSAPATVISYQQATLSAQLSGLLMELIPSVGDEVKKGDTLARIDCRDYRLAEDRAAAEVSAAQAMAGLARQQLARAKRLQKQGNVSRELQDQRQAELNSSRASLLAAEAAKQQASLAVSRCDIAAPFSGSISQRLVSPGNLMAPGTALLEIIGDQNIELSAHLSPQQVLSIERSAELTFDSYGEKYPIRLRVAVAAINSIARTRDVRLAFISSKPLPGAVGRLSWYSSEQHIPARYLVQRGQQLGVMLFEQGKARFYPLSGAVEGQSVAVDLAPETQLITDGRFSVSDGDSLILADDR